MGHLWDKFKERVSKGEEPGKVLDDLGVKRYCCRRTLFTSVTYVEEISLYHTRRARRLRRQYMGGGAEY